MLKSKIGLIVLLFSGLCFGRQSYLVRCDVGGTTVATAGLSSTNKVEGSFPGCSVTVNIQGGGLATIFSDNIGTSLSNPFTTSTQTGYGIFYADNGRYSVTLSGAGIIVPVVISDVLLNDPASPLGCSSVPALTGDVTSAGGTCATVLPNISTAGTGLKTTINAKGQVTGVATAASTDLSDTTIIARLNAPANFGANAISGGAITGTTGTFSGAVTAPSATISGEIAPDVTGRALGDTSHRWDLFARNLDISGTVGGITNTGNETIAGTLAAASATFSPTSNGVDAIAASRFTDTTPTGNFLNFKSLAAVTLFRVDIAGNVTAASVTTSGGGSLGGTFTGNPVFSGNVTLTGTTVANSVNGACNAAQQSGADICAKINTCETSILPAAGGEVYVPAGQYSACAAPIVLSVPTVLHGAGAGIATNLQPTLINVAATVTGLQCNSAGQYSHIYDLYLKSASTVLGTDDGIQFFCHGFHVENVVVDHFGRRGFSNDTSVSGNTNNWFMADVRAVNNIGDGFFWAGNNGNAGTCINCDASTNTGWGFNEGGVATNVFITPHTSNNTAGSYQETSASNRYISPYCEGGGNFTITAGANNTHVDSANFGQCTFADSSGSTDLGYVVGTFYGRNRVTVVPQPGAIGPTVYQFLSGNFGNSVLSFVDQTNSANIFTYDPSNRWNFRQNVTFSAGITNGTGIQMFSTSTTCTTGAAIGAICTTAAITLPVAYADTNYRLTCTGQGPTNVPIVQTYTKSNTTFTITISALTAAAATFSSYDCTADHN